MKYTLAIILAIGLLHHSIGQGSVQGSKVRDNNNNFLQSDMSFTPKKLDMSEVRGSELLFEEPQRAVLTLANGNYSEDLAVNVDLMNHNVHAIIRGEWLSIPLSRVHEIHIKNKLEHVTQIYRIYMNVDDHGRIYRVLSDGIAVLLEGYTTRLIRPNYNHVLNTGRKYHSIKVNKSKYVFLDKMIRLPKRSRDLYEYIAD